MTYLVPSPVQGDEVRYWMHYAAHFAPGSVELQAARRFEESLLRLIRQRDRIRSLRRTLRVNGLTGWIDPTTEQQENLFDATQTFFENFYASLSDLAALCARAWGAVDSSSPPPRSSMRKFLGWLAWVGEESIVGDALPDMVAARDFRTVLDHGGLNAPFDWGTTEMGRFTQVRLFGPLSTSGRMPDGASPGAFPWEGWHFLAPNEVPVTEGLAECARFFMPVLFGTAVMSGNEIEDPAMERPRPATLYSPDLKPGEIDGWHVRTKPPSP